ncbi:Lrp/AsnC family transcriptional regulator [Desulfovibrio sulfodismutans]|uniref:siroheme decarboxylase n=1 Tax=Desulfolutivibrio sulfodismutans TaxID=63561 RepID=A0A7K3NS16_9BACT|nr:Lrp/AsnC family transcriptional regulator [Desulfolutivibrio sulfodismutans]NDY58980.1 Lrp/AsnC family transcriptional regulator [Desulfolutivibrio sulfodismutans]QLA13273.1 Lrp/AsnC family transcriptional regulator [Desulfolutivibrio sulfodismutans DSM 3696]
MPKETKPVFSETERRILRMAQADLPDSATPYADMAAAAGATEAEVLDLLARLKESGAIRRFGATLRHQKAGYGANAMVAWYVDDDDMARVGKYMSSRREISHCYHRINCLDWPYNLYTMVHAGSPEECRRIVEELVRESGVDDYAMLLSRKELKKTSMEYF